MPSTASARSKGTAQDQLPVEQTASRSDRRRRVVDAFIDLVLEGSGQPPTPEEIAVRAGVSRATFFRYFATLNDLRGEAATRALDRFSELVVIPDMGTGSLHERINRLVDARMRFHETLHPLALLLRASATLDADSAELVDAIRQILSDQVRQHFWSELELRTPARRDDLVVSITVLTSVESWHQFRRAHDRSPAQTRRAWNPAVVGILAQT